MPRFGKPLDENDSVKEDESGDECGAPYHQADQPNPFIRQEQERGGNVAPVVPNESKSL